MRRIASIDIGTNTVLLLIADTDGKEIVPVHFEQRIPRLGYKVDKSRKLHLDSMARVVMDLSEYGYTMARHNVTEYIVTATSAVRDAKNRGEFLSLVKNQVGFDITIISGEMEAKITWAGALSALKPEQRPDVFSVLDIGGGSSELASGDLSGPTYAKSLDMGAVRFQERFFSEGYSEKALEEAKSSALELLDTIDKTQFVNKPLMAVAGTVTSLAFMELDLEEFDPAKINGLILTRKTIDKWLEWTVVMGKEELEKRWPTVMRGRADIFPAGLLLLSSVLEALNLNEVVVSCGGIREGALLFRYNGRI